MPRTARHPPQQCGHPCRQPLLLHLSTVKYKHWDVPIRLLAAQFLPFRIRLSPANVPTQRSDRLISYSFTIGAKQLSHATMEGLLQKLVAAPREVLNFRALAEEV